MTRENVAWTVVTVVVASFLAVEVFLLTTIVTTLREHEQRLGRLECDGRTTDEAAGRSAAGPAAGGVR